MNNKITEAQKLYAKLIDEYNKGAFKFVHIDTFIQNKMEAASANRNYKLHHTLLEVADLAANDY